MQRTLLALLILAAACGDDNGSTGDRDAGSTTSPSTGSSPGSRLDAGIGDAASASRGDAGSSTATKTSVCSMLPAHTQGENFFGCSVACDQGFADCDGDITNGCEVALSPDSCEQCHAASCLLPALCGLSAAVCQSAEGTRLAYAGRAPSEEPFLRSLVAGAAPGQLIASVDPAPAGGSAVKLPTFGGSLVATNVSATSVLWSATGTRTSYLSNLARVKRVGDRLYILDTVDNEAYQSGVLIVVANLDGSLVWTKTVSGVPADLCAQHITADAENNVYLAYGVCSSDSFDDPDYTVDGVGYDSDDGTLLAAFDAQGNARWTVQAVSTTRKVCRNGAESDLLDLTVAGGRLFGINEICLAEFDVATGALIKEQELYVEMNDFAVLRADATGNLYVGSDSGYGDVLPAPSAIAPGQDVGKYGGSSAVQVSKYRPDLSHAWSRSFMHRGVYFGDKPSDASFRDFDVTPAGAGMVVGMVGTLYNSNPYQPLVVAFDTDGKITGSAKLDMYYEATALSYDSAGTAYVGGVGKSINDKLERGVFIKEVTLK